MRPQNTQQCALGVFYPTNAIQVPDSDLSRENAICIKDSGLLLGETLIIDVQVGFVIQPEGPFVKIRGPE